MVSQFRHEAELKRSSSSEQQVVKPGKVTCDVCTGTKLKALKSCLVCLVSYCETHLEPHLTVSGLKRHQLMDPVKNLEVRMCREHDKPLELFCKTDHTCVCMLCSVLDHKTHEFVPLKEEYEGKKAELEKTEAEIQQMIQKRRMKIQEIKRSVRISKEGADRETAEGVQVFTALKESVERGLNQLIQEIEDKHKTTEKQAEDSIKELEQEISDLMKRSSEVEQLSRSEDHLHLLQSFQSLEAAPPTKNWTHVRVHPSSYEGSVVRAVSQLEEMLIHTAPGNLPSQAAADPASSAMVDLLESSGVSPGLSRHGNNGKKTSKKSRTRRGKRGRRRRNKKNNRNNKTPPPFLPPEAEEGNIEYKLKLVNPTQYRFEHLATQLKWRLQEGRGEAVYQIGVEDNGLLVGLTEADMKASLKTLKRMAEKVGADITLLREREVDYDLDRSTRKIAEVLVRKVPDDQQFLDLRVAVLGNVDSGKSTLLGVLTQGELDNGRGRARLNLFRHLHEIQTGRTSSISFEILGFNSKGEVVNYSESRTAEEICESSSKMITFIDLAGHHKYLKTTIFGLTSYCPDFAMLVVSANTGIAGTTREHLGLAMALKVPIFIVVSKVDLCSRGTVERTVRQLERVLKQPGCNKVPMVVSNPDDAVTAAQQFTQSTCVTPIFTLSSVSGENLDLLKVFLNILPPLSNSKEQEELMQQLTEFQVDEIYSVPDVGTVVGGTLYSGVCREGERLVVGPTDEGRFLRLKVGSIQRNRSACRVLRAGQAATLALGNFDRSLLRKGMVMVSPKMNPTICCQFEAAIVLLFHAKTFRRGSQVTVHVGNVRQTATVECLHGKDELRTGERAVVRFRFIKHPEYLRLGAKLLFREGVTKGIGHVTRLLPPSQNQDQNQNHDQNLQEP
ncbi:hypothetical protein Q8A73_002801 [Channa argus]|nr:hypothetical protein Q8A73_002801 [Channa argus]